MKFIGCQIRHIQLQKDLQCSKEELVERSGATFNISNLITCRSQEHIDSKISERSSETSYLNTGREKRGKGDRIIDFLRQYAVSPINHIFNLPFWLTSNYKFFNKLSSLMINIMKIHSNFYNDLTVEELYTHFMGLEPQYIVFNSPTVNIDHYYMNLTDSIFVMEELANYQFYNNQENVKQFFFNLFNILDRKVPKKNTLFILSAPNAGKNKFWPNGKFQ